MDYEKAYKNAMEVMRQWIAPCHDEKQLNVLKKAVFPELAEGEDERIRKFLIEKFSKLGELWPEYSTKTILDWLKKQKPTEKPEDIHNRGYIKGVEDAYHNINEAKVILKNLAKENPKPTECIDIEKLAEHIKAEFESFRNLLKKKGIDYQPAEVYWIDFARLFDSSAREYSKEQKPAEWSEEDEKRFSDVLSGLKYTFEDLTDKKSVDSAKDIQEAFDWMQERYKSLRPQPHWKPSETQLSRLEFALNLLEEKCDSVPDDLWGLYNDLKKLM